MKINSIQKKICETLISTIRYWVNTNDITSPTHIIDIEDCLNVEFDDIIEDDNIKEFHEIMTELYWKIRKYDKL